MNKKFLLFAGLLLGCSSFAATPSAKDILNYKEKTGKELIYGTGFEDPKEPVITFSEGFRFAKGEGNNGNMGIRGDRVGANTRILYADIKLPVDKIKEGNKYLVTVSVKGKDLRHARRPIPPGSHRFMEVYFRDIKTGAYSFEKHRVVPFAPPPKGEQFKHFECRFNGVKGAKTYIRLALWYEFLGTIWFDDLRVYQDGIPASAFLVNPSCSTFFTDSGKYQIKINIPKDFKNQIVLVQLFNNNKLLKEQVVKPVKDYVNGDLGKNLPLGKSTLKITLADSNQKLKIKTIELPIFVKSKTQLPKNACILDKEGFMLKEGKRFLPLGLFFGMLSHMREEHIQRIGKSPYNFIIDYSALTISPAKDKEKIQSLRKGLDRVSFHGLKTIVNLQPFYWAHSNYVKRGWSGETTTLGMTRKLVKNIKDHPALMGYYLTDELSSEQLALPIEMRRILNEEDPYHPTFTLTNLPSELPDYARSGDIVMYDPYPLRSQKSGSWAVKDDYEVFGIRGPLAGTPIWAAPQGFSWGIQPENIHRFKEFIDPSAEDMRTLMLFSLVEGAKGVCLFNYPFLWNQQTIKNRAKYGLQDYPQDMWKRQVKAASDVKLLEPYFISSLPTPKIKVENKGKAKVKAKLWKAANGKLCLVIIGTGKGNGDAVITVPNCVTLKSKFNHTKHLGNGRYHFTSKDLASDMLFE